MTGRKFTPEETTFQAVGFRAYTPGWGRPLTADQGVDGIGANCGIPGPVLRAEVGDTVKVHFRNNDVHYRWPHSIHPHGVEYDRGNDGGWLADEPGSPGTAVPYGGAFVDNTPTFTAKVGERVRWRIAALGKEFHVFHIHGHRWESTQGYQGWVDSQILGPSTTLTVEYTEDNPGDWIYHCHVTDHMMGGMVGRYRVTT